MIIDWCLNGGNMLKIDVEECGSVVTVSLIGELSFSYVEEFESVFKKYVKSDFNVIALDLKNVPYLDSFGISRIIKVSRFLIAGGSEFVLINMNEHIHQIFRMATFDKLFNIMTKEEFLLAYFQTEKNADNNYTEIVEAGKVHCRQNKDVKIKQMELVDDNGTTLIFLEEE